MRFRGEPQGYTLWLSARETEAWALRPYARWPCSTTAGHRLVIRVDRNGLWDLSLDGRSDRGEIDGTELDAIVADHLPKSHRHLWPVWGRKENR